MRSLRSRTTRVRRTLAVAMAAPLLLVAACGDGGTDALNEGGDGGNGNSGGGGEVVIAYQDYTEMSIMAEMYAALLEAEGYEPTLKGVGDRAIYAGQLASGDVDVAPEYVSSMTEYLNREINGPDAEPVASPDVEETMAQLEELAAEKNMTPLQPAQAEDANAFAVTQQFSDENQVTTLSDLGELGKPIALAAAPDCPDRPDCQGGLEEVYGIQISDFEPLGFGSPQTKDALTSGEVQLGQVGTSDGQIEQLELVVLEDDKDWQNAENLVPVVSTDFLEQNPEVEGILNGLSDVLTTEDLMRLNAAVDAERQLASDVAEDYLQEKGLI
ncbi:MAG TPA: ABC transporter substrate-binding protein [Nocardioidaceae bacterium]|nr:ABC transporter substrate-binding protein [Nocardioidaceae bacterium]